MAGKTVNIGTGTTIAFADSSYTANLLSVDWSGISRETVDANHMGITTSTGAPDFGSAEFLPVDFADGGELSVEVQFDPAQLPPMLPVVVGDSELITLTFPLVSGDSTPADYAFQGFCKNMDITAPLEEVMTATLTIRVTGGVTKTAAA